MRIANEPRRFTLKTFYRICIILAFIIIIVQLFSLQILDGEMYSEISRKNYVRILRINATRGNILDEKLRPIAINRPSINLYFKSFLIQDRQKFFDFVTEHVYVTQEQLERMIYQNRFRAFEDVLIAENLPENVLARIADRMNYFPELILKAESMRLYHIPNHFTGYVAKISDTEFKKFRNEDYTLNSVIGKGGIEKYYEGLLAGKSGYEIIQVDSKGKNLNLFKHDLRQRPVNGFNIVLTINIELQEYIRSIFPKDKAGAVVVINPRTGGVLSYNSFPEYDQNWFSQGLSEAQWDYLQTHELKPQIDRVTMGTYPPGSTWKIISSAFGLEKNYITELTRLSFCNGGMQIGNRYFKCWLAHGHGRSNLFDAMSVSCDVFYYDLSGRFNLDEFSDFAYNSLILSRTGIDLPQERSGFFPKTDWYVARHGRYFSATGFKANLVIGQGEVLTSPLAMCAYYAAIANNGIWLTPHLFRRAFNEENSINYDFFRRQTHFLPYSETTLELLEKTLYDAVNRPDGTARQAKVPGVTVYGKTGSSENHQGELTHASYAGFAKWDGEPELAFYVIVENAGSGGGVAGPIVRKIIEYYNEIR